MPATTLPEPKMSPSSSDKTKHFFPTAAANTLVPRALRALVSANTHLLTLDEPERVVAYAHNDVDAVSIISGGGSGHEPAWSGFVGEGLLSAVACGDIFASPSTKQVLAATRLAPSNKGTIMLITNYTGDRLHFGLAAERAKAEGMVVGEEVVVLPATDDVSIGRSKSSRVGRRGMPGHVFTMKILGAAAAEKLSFQKCLDIGRAVNDNTVSIGSALDFTHVPGRQHQSVPQDVCVLGAGIHNEPGQQLLSPFPSPEELVDRALKLLLDPNDPERYYTKFGKGDSVTLLINNYGGLSPLELGALTDEVQQQLAKKWDIKPVRTLSGTFETSLNAPGFSISLCNLTGAAKQAGCAADELIKFLDRPTSAVYWPNHTRQAPTSPAKANGNGVAKQKPANGTTTTNGESKADDAFRIPPHVLQKAVRTACEFAIAAEPKLTEWDMVMGDGDCGEAVKGLAESVLRTLDSGVASDGSILGLLTSLVDSLEDMGGTLGAILGILLASFITNLKADVRQGGAAGKASTPAPYASALAAGAEALKKHTAAREGDRTVMDVLLPFADEFAKSKDFTAAVGVAKEKAEATRFLKPSFGRATYVGDDAAKQQLPDPGAWGLYEIVAGLKHGIETAN